LFNSENAAPVVCVSCPGFDQFAQECFQNWQWF
jgi:hypothetical protein